MTGSPYDVVRDQAGPHVAAVARPGDGCAQGVQAPAVQTTAPSAGWVQVGRSRGIDLLSVQRIAGNQAALLLLAGTGARARGPASQRTVQRVRDPRLDDHLDQLRRLSLMPYSQAGLYDAVVAELRGVDLTDPDNLVPVTEVLSPILPRERLQTLLGAADRPRPSAPHEDPSRTLRALSSPRRGPYGMRGPGILLPIAGQAVSPLLEPLAHVMNSVDGLVRGLYLGVSSSVSPQAAEDLAQRMLESTILNAVFPPVFLAGTVVGIGSDVVDSIRGAYELVVNIDEILTQAAAILEVVVSPEGREAGRIIGEEIGRGWGAELVRLSRAGVFEFTYRVGEIVGPAIVYTICSFIGLPELAAAAIFARLSARLLPILRRFPRLARLAEAVARRLRRLPTPEVPETRGRPRLRGYTAEGLDDDLTHGWLPEVPGEVPTSVGRGPLRSETDTLTDYAEAVRSGGGGNPATAAARGASGPHIRDNHYSGDAQRRVTRRLRDLEILEGPADASVLRVSDPARYVSWLERAYRQHGGSSGLDPRMRHAIQEYVGGGLELPGVGTTPGGGRSYAGSLPGTHAEILAVNDALLTGGRVGGVATVRAGPGGHFAACLHCRGILERLARTVPELRVLTGAATP